jgi:phosphoenolpyruvate carboxykinase (GTP)
MADYFDHWIQIGKQVEHRPHIFCVNWFRTDENGKFVWPGFGENMRVLKWVVERTQGRANATETAVGWVPSFDDLMWTGLESFDRAKFDQVTSIEPRQWKHELSLHDELLSMLESRLPAAIRLRREQLGLAFGQ